MPDLSAVTITELDEPWLLGDPQNVWVDIPPKHVEHVRVRVRDMGKAKPLLQSDWVEGNEDEALIDR
jgi:hypothetical protein